MDAQRDRERQSVHRARAGVHRRGARHAPRPHPARTLLVMRSRAGIAMAAIATLPWIAGQTKKGGTQMKDTQALEQLAKSAAQSQNSFGLKLMADLAAEHPRQNVFISPLSIYLALAMAETGSAGKTRSAMRHTMAVPGALS